MADDLEGAEMAILNKYGRRPAATLAGRRERETRPLARADRMISSTISTKTRQLNLKVTPEFYERVAALARNKRMSMPNLIELAIETLLRHD